MKNRRKNLSILKVMLLSFTTLVFLSVNSLAAETQSSYPNQGSDFKNVTGVPYSDINDIIVSLRRQESLLKKNLILHYIITQKPPALDRKKTNEAVVTEVNESFETHQVKAIFSGKKMWEQETRFGTDGKQTLMTSFSWNGTSGKRLIISEITGVKKGWTNYNPSSKRSNPTSTQNLLLIFGLLGTQEQSLSDFIANHYKEMEISKKDSEIILKFSALENTLDYSVVLDANHSYWPKLITQFFKNAKEEGVDLGDLKFEYTDIVFGKKDVGDVAVFYPQKMKYISYADPEILGDEKIGTPGELIPIVIDEFSIQSIDFEQKIQDDQFQLDFPEGTILQKNDS